MADGGQYDAEGDTRVVHRARHDFETDAELSTSILLALDEVEGFDAEATDSVAFDAIDLDALDDLFEPVQGAQRRGEVTFHVGAYTVTATAAGDIVIRERQRPE